MLNNILPEKTPQMRARMKLQRLKEIKLKYLSEKGNEYGTNHFFEVLDITPLQELIELGKLWKFLSGSTIISSIWKSML